MTGKQARSLDLARQPLQREPSLTDWAKRVTQRGRPWLVMVRFFGVLVETTQAQLGVHSALAVTLMSAKDRTTTISQRTICTLLRSEQISL